jgi:hypothetical protein
MQDGKAIAAEGAGEWLRDHFKGDPEPRISIAWTVRDEPDEAGFARFLAALFTPITDGPEA